MRVTGDQSLVESCGLPCSVAQATSSPSSIGFSRVSKLRYRLARKASRTTHRQQSSSSIWHRWHQSLRVPRTRQSKLCMCIWCCHHLDTPPLQRPRLSLGKLHSWCSCGLLSSHIALCLHCRHPMQVPVRHCGGNPPPPLPPLPTPVCWGAAETCRITCMRPMLLDQVGTLRTFET